MSWIESESFGLDCPPLADEFIGRELIEGLEPATEIVGVNEVAKMPTELTVIFAVEPLDPVHPFDLPVGPRMVDLGEVVLDAILVASHVEHVGDVSRCWPIGVTWRIPELDAIIGEHGMDRVGHGFDQDEEEG